MSRTSLASSAGRSSSVSAGKPKALRAGARLAVIAPASPGSDAAEERGLAELARLGFSVERRIPKVSEGYFSAPTAERREELVSALSDPRIDGLIALRGGYGSNYLLDEQLSVELATPKCLVGFSDVTSLQIFLWQRRGWTSVYGPMVAAGLEAGADSPRGYEPASFLSAISTTEGGWEISLQGEALASGESEGTLARRMHDPAGNHNWNTVGTRYPRLHSPVGGPRHETVASGPRADASAPSRQV